MEQKAYEKKDRKEPNNDGIKSIVMHLLFFDYRNEEYLRKVFEYVLDKDVEG